MTFDLSPSEVNFRRLRL